MTDDAQLEKVLRETIGKSLSRGIATVVEPSKDPTIAQIEEALKSGRVEQIEGKAKASGEAYVDPLRKYSAIDKAAAIKKAAEAGKTGCLVKFPSGSRMAVLLDGSVRNVTEEPRGKAAVKARKKFRAKLRREAEAERTTNL